MQDNLVTTRFIIGTGKPDNGIVSDGTCQWHADNAAAVAAELTTNMLYKDATGNV